jgi:hypothetical protein
LSRGLTNFAPSAPRLLDSVRPFTIAPKIRRSLCVASRTDASSWIIEITWAKSGLSRNQSPTAAITDKSSYDRSGTEEGRVYWPKSAPALRSRSMTAGEAAVSSRITLIGIALIWMTAQVLVVVAHEFWTSRVAYRNTFGEWCCGGDNCEMRSPDRYTRQRLAHRQHSIRSRSNGDAEPRRKDIAGLTAGEMKSEG